MRGDWLDLGFVRDVILQQKFNFFAFFTAVFGVTLLGTLLAEKEYEAVALIHLLPRAGREVQLDEVVSNDATGYMEARERARTQIQIIQSRAIREEVIWRYNELGYHDYEPTPEGLEAFGRAVSAGPREDTQLVEIRVRHTDPEHAAILANLIAHVYREGSLDERRETARETRDWLEGREDEYRKSLDEANQALIDFKLANDVVDIDEAVTSTGARLTALQNAMSDAATQRLVLETALSEHQRLLRRGETQVLTGMFDDPALRSLAEQRAQVVTESAEVLARYGDQHPDHKKIVAQLKRLDDLLLVEVQRNIEAERVQVKTLESQEARLKEELDALKAQLANNQRLKQEYDELKLAQERAMRFYGQMGQRGGEVDLQSQTRLSEVRIVDEALPPTSPASPNVPLNLIVGFGVGVVGGFGVALLRYRGDELIESADDIEAQFCEPPLGVLPTFPFARRQADRLLYSHEHPRSLLADAMGAVADVLTGLLPPEQSVRLVVSSASPAEGKTTVATGLGISWARKGKRVVIVECTTEKPVYHDAFRLKTEPGLAEALAAPDTAGELVRATKAPGLFVLPGGAAPGGDDARLAGPELAAVLETLGRAYDIVILDMGRDLMLGSARTVVSASNGVVVVARRGLVTRSAVAGTLDELRIIGARQLGLVLNDQNDGSVPAARPPQSAPAPGRPPTT
ncbi:MAG: hypothetical protein H6742_16750 [Alphaproteobacteria bacterium]|nr:hypothetical protein [Alphaproteobacteria bacterium]